MVTPERESLLQREIRQTKPFGSVYQEMVLSMLKTGAEIRRVLSQHLEGKGVTPQQYNVLRILRGAGKEGLPTLAIAERLVEEAPGMTRLLDRLEKRGWVRRERSRDDRRQVYCTITGSGLDLLTKLDPLARELDELFAGTMPAQEAETLVGLLEKIRKGLQ